MEAKVSESKLVIRDAKRDEWPQISELLVAAYSEYDKDMPPDVWDWYCHDIADVRKRSADSELIIALSDNIIAGSVTLYPDGSREGWPKGWAGIRLLGVHPDFRGKGIGRALMEECVRRCRERGTKIIGLHTTEMMKIARGMYERMGFKQVPQFDFHPSPDRTIYAYRLDV